MGAKYPQKRPVTAREAAQMFDCHPSTVRRKIAQPRDEWLAEHAQERAQPWLSLGISRATWYRRGKPLPPEGGDDDEAPRP